MTIYPSTTIEPLSQAARMADDIVSGNEVINRCGWICYSEPEIVVYTDREKTVRIGSFSEVTAAAKALGFVRYADEPRRDMPTDFGRDIRFVISLTDIFSAEDAGKVCLYGIPEKVARQMKADGMDIELMISMFQGT